ncbi:MAG: hypothetical protein M3A24_01395 [Candidatus Rhabdochlamydia oedothoracis]|nr:hypothetical protein [Candidatus Rhabdochlamydia oedothoracis]
MTISRIFSSFYNLYSQAEAPVEVAKIQVPIQEEVPKEGKVHTWNLVNGDKAHLMCNNGKLECHFITSNGAITINDIDPPASFTQEQAIHFLLELCPSLSESNCIQFIEYGEEIHNWHLKDGRKAHLTRRNDQLECYIINDKETIISQIDPPDWLTPEEAINRLLEMYPILHEDNSVKFIENQEELHTWEVKYGNPVTLFRVGEEVGYRTVYGENEVTRTFSMPDKLSLFEGIEWIKKRYPHVYPIKENGEKSCNVKFKEKIIEQKRSLDEKILLDMNHWCITLMNADNSNECPCSWMGHASLIIETVEEEGYFIRSAHLIKTAGKADIIFSEVPRKKLVDWAREVSKSQTWSRPKEHLQDMIDQIYREIIAQRNKDPLVFFRLDAGRLEELWATFVRARQENRPFGIEEILRQREVVRYVMGMEGRAFYNCIEYSRRNLSLAGIEIPVPQRGLLSNIVLPTPVLYVGSRLKAVIQEVSLATLWVGRPVGTYALLGHLFPLASNLDLIREVALPALVELAFAYNREQDNQQIQE